MFRKGKATKKSVILYVLKFFYIIIILLKYYFIVITVTILAAFPASLEKRNSAAVARGAIIVAGAFVPIWPTTFRQGQGTEEYKAQNGNLHLEILLVMEARKAEMKKQFLITLCMTQLIAERSPSNE